MAVSKLEVVDLRKRFLDFIIPINKEVKQQCLDAGILPVSFFFPRECHLFLRILQRNIDRAILGTIFSKLMRGRLCEVICLCEQNKPKGNTTSFSIAVLYKGVIVPFQVKRFEDRFQLTPNTCVVSKTKNPKRANEVLIDLNT